tara:strand:+ start:692 stop:877 length:186 start_codon:yes stop_codon:yes gene_type:complete
MPPKRDIYVTIMDPVEKQNIKIEKSKKRCSCKRCLCVSFFLGIIGVGGLFGYLYYNNDINL